MHLRDLLDLIQTLAVLTASGTAIYGITSWRRELMGKKQYELAEEALSLFYRAKDIISMIRSLHGNVDEGKSRPATPGENLEQKKARDQAYTLWERYLEHEEIFNRLRVLRYRFMAVYGKEATKPFDDLNRIVNELILAVRMLGDAWYRQSQTFLPRTDEENNRLTELIDRYQAIFWEGMKDPDPINDIVRTMIEGIERTCVPILSGK